MNMKSKNTYVYDPKSRIEKNRLREREKRTSTRRSFALDGLDFGDVKCVLDVGCGSGAAGFDILSRTTSASLVGVDIELSILNEANNESPNNKCHFVSCDGFSLPFSDSSFDLVVCQYVLQHLSSPTSFLEEMRRVCYKGARAILFEWDDDVNFSYPKMPKALRKLFDAKIELIHDGGGDRLIGRKLYHLLQSAGWKDIEIKLVHDIWQGPADRSEALRGTELSLKEIRPQLIGSELISVDEFELGMSQLYNYFCSDIFSVAVFFAGIGINPG